ncbi:MAG: ABC transporter permease, partial [Chloroflexi bacterium]
MPYALLLPGLLWLGLFFVTPILTLLSTSLQE